MKAIHKIDAVKINSPTFQKALPSSQKNPLTIEYNSPGGEKTFVEVRKSSPSIRKRILRNGQEKVVGGVKVFKAHEVVYEFSLGKSKLAVTADIRNSTLTLLDKFAKNSRGEVVPKEALQDLKSPTFLDKLQGILEKGELSLLRDLLKSKNSLREAAKDNN